jgi:hypothetical protein
VGTVFLPGGTYRLSDALHLPSHTRLLGAGAGLTRLQAISGTLFPLVRPDPRAAEIRQRRTMITTRSAGTARQSLAENIGLAHLTVDWNHCPTESFGSACVLIDSADRCRLEHVHFERCMPSDHPRRLEDMRGSAFRCECILFSNTHHALMDTCVLGDSGYRPLSVAYGSLDITFVLQGGTAQDGICSHTGTMSVENCDFYIRGGTEHFGFVIKTFDGSRRCQCLNNRFHCEGHYDQHFSIIGSIGSRTNEELLFVGNIIDILYSADIGDRRAERGLVDFSRSEVRCRVQDNQFLIRCEAPIPMSAIRLENARVFTVAGNLIEFRGRRRVLGVPRHQRPPSPPGRPGGRSRGPAHGRDARVGTRSEPVGRSAPQRVDERRPRTQPTAAAVSTKRTMTVGFAWMVRNANGVVSLDSLARYGTQTGARTLPQLGVFLDALNPGFAPRGTVY